MLAIRFSTTNRASLRETWRGSRARSGRLPSRPFRSTHKDPGPLPRKISCRHSIHRFHFRFVQFNEMLLLDSRMDKFLSNFAPMVYIESNQFREKIRYDLFWMRRISFLGRYREKKRKMDTDYPCMFNLHSRKVINLGTFRNIQKARTTFHDYLWTRDMHSFSLCLGAQFKNSLCYTRNYGICAAAKRMVINKSNM